MKAVIGLLFAVATLPAATAWGQPTSMNPHLGYLYPAGGRQGSTIVVMAGGQALRGASGILVSGDGVRARVVKHYRPVFNIDKEQRQELQMRIVKAWTKQASKLPGGGRALIPPGMRRSAMAMTGSGGERSATGKAPTFEHPLLYDLDEKDLRELQHEVPRFAPLWTADPP